MLFRTYSWPPAKPRAVASGVDGASDLGVGKFNGDHHARQDHFVIERQHRQRERFAHQPLLKVESPTLKKEEPVVISGLLSAHSEGISALSSSS